MEDYLRRAAIWPGAPVIDDPEGLLGEKSTGCICFPMNPSTVTAKEEIFSRKEKWKNGKESMPQLFILWYNRPILMYGGQVNEGL